jgi:4-amino-4-deoxy-L-arabinose transferase-like glycosyltransferase
MSVYSLYNMGLPFRGRDSLFLFLVVIAAFSIGASKIGEPLGFDEGLFLSVGYFMKKGFVLYSDLVDTKPPLIYLLAYLNSVLLSDNTYPLRVLMLLITSLTFIPVFLISRRYFGTGSAYLACILLLFFPPVFFMGSTFHVDVILPFFGLWSAYFLLTGVESESKARLFLAGLSMGFVLATKQTGVYLFAVSALYMSSDALVTRQYGASIRRLSWFLSGLLVASVPILLFVLKDNALYAAFYSLVSFNLEYSHAGLDYMYSNFSERVFVLFSLFVLSPLIWFLALPSIPGILKKRVNGQLFILAWFLVEFAGIATLMPHIWYQHFYTVLVLACISRAPHSRNYAGSYPQPALLNMGAYR